MKRKIISVILIFILLQSVVLAATTSDLNNQKSDIQNKINEAQDQQLDIEDELDDQMKEISSLDAEISEVEEEISKLKAQISELETSIEEKQTELEKKQKEYEENDELLQERLVATYENGDTTFLDILFNSSNIIDFLSNYYTISQLVECDQELLESIEKEEQEIEETKNNLEEQKQEVEELKSSQETKANTLKLKRAERQTKVSELNDEQKKLQEQIDSYNEDIKKIDEQIKEIYAQAQKQAQASGLKFDGSFIWPCNNKVITSTVKIRWGRWHKGLDIGAYYESVYAAASGYAYTLENPGGYGHYIMIVHGSGYITLYGHLNSFNITSGQYVSQGQVIATSGNSGASQGAHLHFEIRKASSVSNYFSSDFLNPLDYLPGGYTYAAGATTSS